MIKWFERNSWFCWIIVVAIASGIFYLSSLTFGGGGGGSNIYAIVYHIGVFFLLAFFLMMALVRGRHKSFIFLAFVLAIFYGVTDEIHQLFVQGRDGSIRDVLYDGVGAVFAFMVYMISLEWRRK